jgi:hypothetical protein
VAVLLCKSISPLIAAILLLVCGLTILPGERASLWAVTGNRPHRVFTQSLQFMQDGFHLPLFSRFSGFPFYPSANNLCAVWCPLLLILIVMGKSKIATFGEFIDRNTLIQTTTYIKKNER